MKAISSLQIPTIKKDQKLQLRGVNLSKNMFSRIYLLHSLQQQQLLILNMSNNLIQSLVGIEQCKNLQFLNLSHNMITDISQLSKLRYLQEVYLSHNLISSLIMNQSQDEFENIYTIWSFLEVLDLTHNKLNDFEEILFFLNGVALRKEIIKIIAIKGNQFYNYNEVDYKHINQEIEGKKLIELFSSYSSHQELNKLCFDSNKNNYDHTMIPYAQKASLNIPTSQNILSQAFSNKNELFYSTAVLDNHRQSKTKLDVRTARRGSPNTILQSRSTSRNTRPKTQLYQSYNGVNKIRTSTSCTQKSINQNYNQFTSRQSSMTRQKQQYSYKKSISNNFKQKVTMMSQQLSLKNKQNSISYQFDKSLSRNVRFLDLSHNPTSEQDISSSLINNGNKSSLSFNNNSQQNPIQPTKSIIQPTHHYYKKSILNRQLKKSIDMTLNCQTTTNQSKAIKFQFPHSTKHQPSNSFSFTNTFNKLTNKQKPQNMNVPSKRKQSSPIKPVSIRDKSLNNDEFCSQSCIVYEEKSNEDSNSKERQKAKTFIYQKDPLIKKYQIPIKATTNIQNKYQKSQNNFSKKKVTNKSISGIPTNFLINKRLI